MADRSAKELFDGRERSGDNLPGRWSGLVMAAVALVAFVVAITTLPRSGPFCTGSCLVYPFAGAAQYVPGDYRWMWLAILLTPLFVVVMACLHSVAGADSKAFSRIALGFALISATLITADYFIQLEVMQPSILRGDTDGMALFSQYNPHGVFIALEDLGYLIMSVAFLFAGRVFHGARGVERALRCVLWIAGMAALVTYAAMYLRFGTSLEYRFEVTIITINWMTLVVAGVLLEFWFRRRGVERG